MDGFGVYQALTDICLLRLGNELRSRTVCPLRDDILGVVIVAGGGLASEEKDFRIDAAGGSLRCRFALLRRVRGCRVW